MVLVLNTTLKWLKYVLSSASQPNVEMFLGCDLLAKVTYSAFLDFYIRGQYDVISFEGIRLSVDIDNSVYYRWIFEIPFWICDILLVWTVLVVYDATVGRFYWAYSKTGKDRDSLHESLRSSVHIVLLRSPVTVKTDFTFSISSNVTHCKHFPQTQYDFTNGCTAQNSPSAFCSQIYGQGFSQFT